MTFTELAERCEQTTEPDRELDALINDVSGRRPTMPAYTASLDAAMTLVPEGWGWTMSVLYVISKEPCVAFCLHPERLERGGLDRRGDAPTPALALCAAALRARAATQPQSGVNRHG